MSTEVTLGRARRLSTAMREEERVTPLELFFDRVFVLAFTQCTALMASDPTWEAHVAFRYRHIHTLNTRRLTLAVALVAFIPVAVEIAALTTISVLAAALVILIVVETRSYGEARRRLRQELRHRGSALYL